MYRKKTRAVCLACLLSAGAVAAVAVGMLVRDGLWGGRTASSDATDREHVPGVGTYTPTPSPPMGDREATPSAAFGRNPTSVRDRRSGSAQPFPVGYTLADAPVEMATRRAEPLAGDSRADTGSGWLGSQTAIRNLSRQAAVAGRDWSFGWVRLAADATVDELRGALAGTGAELLGSSSGEFVRMRLPGDAARLELVAALESVAALGVLPPEAKLRGFDEGGVGSTTVFVTLMTDDSDGRWRRELESLGAEVGHYDAALRTYAATAPPGRTEALAAADFVLAVEPVGTVRPAHDTAVPALGADALRTWSGTQGLFDGIGGASVPVGLVDSGLNIAHADIIERRASVCGANLVANEAYLNDRDLWIDRLGHGTHAVGGIAGNGFLAPSLAGMAPAVGHLRVAKVFGHEAASADMDTILRAINWLSRATGCGGEPLRAAVVNMGLTGSVAAELQGRDAGARKLDSTVWSSGQLYVVAQGNDGANGLSGFAAAKNSLAVGAVSDDGVVASFSGRGPTGDGRLAPQVVTTGVGVCSAQGDGKGFGYVCRDGTSSAAAAATGIAALLMDHVPAYRALPAMVRARLMAAAVRPSAWLDDPARFPATNSGGPGAVNALYGLGRVSARTTVLNRDVPEGWFGGAAHGELQDGTYAAHELEVPPGASQLVVVLTWDEGPAVAVGDTVLNDVDLWLDLGGDCGGSACGEHASKSRIDNVEWIIVRDPAPGTYHIKAVAHRPYAGTPRLGVSWTVIRGSAMPQLSVAASQNPVVGSEGVRALELAVEVATDAYVAAGARLHLECRGADADCAALRVSGGRVSRSDGVQPAPATVVRDGRSRERGLIAMASPVPLGEVAVGDSRTATFDLEYTGKGSVGLHVVASAWNARGASGAVVVGPPGASGDGAGRETELAPANDDFTDAERIEGDEGAVALDLVRATPDPGGPLLTPDFGRPLGSAWYEWTASANDIVRFGAVPASGGSQDIFVDVYRGGLVGALDGVASGHLGGRTGSFGRDAVLVANAGETYRVRVAHGGPSVPLELRWRRGLRPSNDDLAHAWMLDGAEGDIDGSNAGATLELGESLGPLSATTWHRWTAPEDGAWRFSVDVDELRVAAFADGTTADDLRLVSGFPGSAATFRAREEEVYLIAVATGGDQSSGGGAYALSWEMAADWSPEEDDFAQAEHAGPPLETFDARLAGQTVEPGEPRGSGVRTRWWRWTAPEDRSYTWQLDATASLRMAAHAGGSLESLEPAGTNRIGGGPLSRELSFPAEAGGRYWLSVGWAQGDDGAYSVPEAAASLQWGPTPRNDVPAGAHAIGSTRGIVAASNLFATTATGELRNRMGHSTLWFSYETPTTGWYQMSILRAGDDWVLSVYEIDEAGSRRRIAWREASWLWFRAVAGRRYEIAVGTAEGGRGDRFDLAWIPTVAPAWIRFAGAFDEGPDAPGGPERLHDTGSLAFDGGNLYAVSALGMTAFARDPETGALTGLHSVGDDLAASLLAADPERKRVIANRCGTWRTYRHADAAVEAADLPVENDPASCGSRLFLDPSGSFLYRVVRGTGVESFTFGDAGQSLRHTGSLQIGGLRDAVIDPTGDRVYALSGFGTTVDLSAYPRDPDTGLLLLPDRVSIRRHEELESLAPGDGYLYAVQPSTGYTEAYSTRTGDAAPALSFWRRLVLDRVHNLSTDLAQPFGFAAVRRDSQALDLFGTGTAAAVHFVRGGVDVVAHGQPDRFGNRPPNFGAPTGLAESADGRHVYVATARDGILAFERVGAGAEPEDPHVRLDILTVSLGRLSFPTATNAEDCIAVDGIEHRGIEYSVRTSRWQRRPNGDWPWSDLPDTTASEELCPLSPDDPGNYRLVAEMEIDGETAYRSSNALVVDDHGSGHEDATTVEVPSATAGWLDIDESADHFRVELDEPGELTVYTAGFIDTTGVLYIEDGTVIAHGDDEGADYNFRIVARVDAGEYFIEVAEFFGSPGGYTLHVSQSD